MSFADVSFGIPVPVKTNNDRENSELAGVPVSRGVVEGRVRLVSSMNEARFLKEGEIIVAREYGLPAVVSMKGAMSVLQTGQLIRLDAIKGKVDVVRE
jgi:pyruvate,water dikinase